MKPSLLTLVFLTLTTAGVLSAPTPAPDTTVDEIFYVDKRIKERDENTVDDNYYPQAHTGWGSWKKAAADAETAAAKEKRDKVDDSHYP